MNTTPYMDKQIMDLSQGSPVTQSKGFIDLMKHPEEEEEADHNTHHTLQIAGARKDGIDKKEEILASYDFQPIRPVGVVAPPSQSPNFDATPVLAGRTWSSTSDSKLNTTTTAAAAASTRDYGSLSIEPAKVILEKDYNAFDSPIVSEIDRTMKKHADNLLHVLEGVGARITQLESRTRNLENSVDNLKVSVGNNHGSTDGRLRQLENILREVYSGVEGLKGKQLVLGGEPGLAKLQTSGAEQQPVTQNTVQVDPVQHAASVPQQSQQHLPSANNQQALPALPPPNTPPQPSLPTNLPPSFQFPPQFVQNHIPYIPQHEPYFPPPGQTPEAPNQQYQSSSQQLYPPSAAPPQQQFQPGPQLQFSEPPPQLPQQRPSLAPANPPQLQPSLSHHAEDVPYVPQNHPPSLRQPPIGPPPTQQVYGAPSHMYESLSSRSGSGFSSRYGPPSGPTESYHYSGSPQYGGTSPVKPPFSSAVVQSGGTGYPQLPTARVLPQTLPSASGVGSDSGSVGTGNRVPVDDVVDKVTSMGFPRDHVRATVRKLTENGQSVDLNIVLDKLMNDGEVQPPRGWFGR